MKLSSDNKTTRYQVSKFARDIWELTFQMNKLKSINIGYPTLYLKKAILFLCHVY